MSLKCSYSTRYVAPEVLTNESYDKVNQFQLFENDLRREMKKRDVIFGHWV